MNDELEQKIVELQNQISELKQFVSYGNYSNTIMQNKNLIQTNGAMQSPNFVTGVSGWSLDAEGNLEASDGLFRGNITGSTITGSTLQTATSGARVVIDDENNITLYDDSTGGGGTVTGNSSEIIFTRTDDDTKGFIIRERAGKNNDNENVLELFAQPPATGYSNYLFLGRQGVDDSYNMGYIELTSNIKTSRSAAVSNGSVVVNVSTNTTPSSYSQLAITDARNILGSSASGVVSFIRGSGTNGFGGIGYENSITFYQDSSSLKIGANLIPEVGSTYDFGSLTYRIGDIYAVDLDVDDINADNIYGDIFANNGIDAVIEDVNGDFFLFSDGILILQY